MPTIEYPERMRQINDFGGLKYGTISPTDIDFLIEYKNKAYIFGEIKLQNKEVPYGQKLALERLVKDTNNNRKTSIAIIAEHNIENVKDSIPVAECNVREYFYNFENVWKWRPPREPIKVNSLMDKFIKLCVK